MAYTVTRSDLRTRAKYRAGMENSDFVTDAEWNTYLQSNLRVLWDMFADVAPPDFVRSTQSITTTPGTSDYALNADFYKLIGVFMVEGTRRHPLPKISNVELGVYDAPSGAYSVQVMYFPTCPIFTADSGAGGTFDFFGVGWEELLVQMTARDALDKEESDVTSIVQRIQELKADIRSAASRDIGAPEYVTDVYEVMYPQFYGAKLGAFQQWGSTLSLYAPTLVWP